MTLGSPKGSNPSTVAYPRTLSSIAISVGGLAIFLIFASLLLVSYPISSTVGEYFYGTDSIRTLDILTYPGNLSSIDPDHSSDPGISVRTSPSKSSVVTIDRDRDLDMDMDNTTSSLSNSSSLQQVVSSSDALGLSEPKERSDKVLTPEERFSVSSNSTINIETVELPSVDSQNKSVSIDTESGYAIPTRSDGSNSEAWPVSSTSNSTNRGSGPDVSDCDLYIGSWVYDPLGPLYTNNTCPVLTQMQNCQGNGRPDKEYENWRWKPSQCDLPRFDAKKFLELMRGKTLAFIGDSVARNQMESMLCILWQVEVPKNRGNRKMQRWYFRSTSVTIVRIWSSWLVHQTSEAFDFAPKGVTKIHLDAPDEGFMEFLPTFDVVVLSSGHWFAKQSVYILNNQIVGGQLWWPNKSQPMKVNNVKAFGISTETILTAIATHPNFTGLAIVRSYSPDHYEGGAWNTGGSCTDKVRPLGFGELVKNGFTETMHKKQVRGFKTAVKKATAEKSKLKLMDITEAFGYRHDGHPGPYRNPDPKKVTKRGRDGRPPPQDCLHWCMPGPVDIWNELVLEVIRRDFEGNLNLST